MTRSPGAGCPGTAFTPGSPRPRRVSLRPGVAAGAGPGLFRAVAQVGAGPFRGVSQAGGVVQDEFRGRGPGRRRGLSGAWPMPGAGPRPGPFLIEDQVRGGAQAGGVARAIPGAGPGRPRRRTWR